MQHHKIYKYFNLITIYIVLLLLPVIFFPTTASMVSVWHSNETFTHGYLIFPITIWLIWQKRSILSQTNAVLEPRTFILIIPIFIFWYVSYIVDVQITQQFALILLIQTTLWFLLGRHVIKLILFPLLFLFFSVPFGQSFIPPLMEFTANVTVFMVQLTGIPIYQEGLFFTLPSGNWSVVEECSGVRYLIASMVLGTLFAYTSYSSKKKIAIFILISILLPIIANSFRAFGIVMIGHYSGMTLAVGVDHLVYGWVFFGIVIFLLFFIGSYWADPLDTFKQPPAKKTIGLTPTKPKTIIINQLSLFLIITFIIYGLNLRTSTYNLSPSLVMPDHFSTWQARSDRELEWKPIIHNSDTFISKGYVFDQDFVQLNIGYFGQQRNGAEAISTMNHIASPLGGNWKKLTGRDFKLDNAYLSETELRYETNQLLVWQWYQIGEYETPNPYIAKLFDAYNLIINNRNDAAMITIATPINVNKETSRKVLKDFYENASLTINHTINEL